MRDAISGLRPVFPRVRWSETVNAHLTLAFLGDVETKRIPEIEAGMRRACEGVGPFTVEFRGVGAFRSFKHAHVLWIGVKEGAEYLCAMEARLRTELVSKGFHLEMREFHPHLTLTRLKAPCRLSDGDIERVNALSDSAKMQVDCMILYSSKTESAGAVHEPIARQALTGNPS